MQESFKLWNRGRYPVGVRYEVASNFVTWYNDCMKTCSRCNQEKAPEAFGWRSLKNQTRHSWCKVCRKAYDADSWRNGSKKKTTLAKRAEVVERNQEYIKSILINSSCVDCKVSDPRVLQFDHIKGEKKYNVSAMFDFSLELIKDEIKKCEIVCANCHQIRTSMRAGNWRSLWL